MTQRKTASRSLSSKPVKRGARIKAQVRLMLDDEIAMGPGKADILSAIETTGSISGAGKQLGMSYRRAWLLVDTMNRCFRQPLVLCSPGGAGGGGATLSEQGRAVLARYRLIDEKVAQLADAAFGDLKQLLRSAPRDN